MKLTYDIDLNHFEAWSGAVATLDKIINEGKADVLEAVLEDLYPDGMDETTLNDILWFDDEWCFEMCGIRSESVIREELEEAQEALEELMENFKDECEDMIEFNNESRAEDEMEAMDAEEIESLKAEIWANNYADEAEEINARIAELEEELEDF